jgi:hypothetical protein
MRFVIDYEDVFHPHQVRHQALEHLAFRFEGPGLLARTSLQELASTLGNLHALAKLEGVIVSDDDLGPVHIVEHVAGNEFPAGVVSVGVIRLEHAQPVFDRQAGRADEKTAREILARRPEHRVDRLPGDEHGHDRGLARAGG